MRGVSTEGTGGSQDGLVRIRASRIYSEAPNAILETAR